MNAYCPDAGPRNLGAELNLDATWIFTTGRLREGPRYVDLLPALLLVREQFVFSSFQGRRRAKGVPQGGSSDSFLMRLIRFSRIVMGGTSSLPPMIDLDIRDRFDSVVCLSTPFIAVGERNFGKVHGFHVAVISLGVGGLCGCLYGFEDIFSGSLGELFAGRSYF